MASSDHSNVLDNLKTMKTCNFARLGLGEHLQKAAGVLGLPVQFLTSPAGVQIIADCEFVGKNGSIDPASPLLGNAPDGDGRIRGAELFGDGRGHLPTCDACLTACVVDSAC